MRFAALLLYIVGLIGCAMALSMNTTVIADIGGRVQNFGLLSTQMVFAVIGAGAFVSGAEITPAPAGSPTEYLG